MGASLAGAGVAAGGASLLPHLSPSSLGASRGGGAEAEGAAPPVFVRVLFVCVCCVRVSASRGGGAEAEGAAPPVCLNEINVCVCV